MEERKLNEKESLALIAQMIQRTRTHLRPGDGNVYLLWGYTSVAVAALVWIAGQLSGHPAWNFLWFLIWVVGGTMSHHMKQGEDDGVRTYVDRISTGLWSMVGWLAMLFTVCCLGFMLVRGADCWAAMLIFGLFAVGFAASVQGIIVCEKCLTWGGAAGMAAGVFVLCCLLAGIPIHASWVILLFMAVFVCMLIVPGYVLNRKARRSHV